jgi:exosortase A
MHAEPRLQTAAIVHGVQRPGLVFGAIVACIVVVLGIFWPTTASMIEIWWRSETFQRCFVVIPIVLWLVWGERARLAAAPMQPFWPGLALIALLGLVWLLGVLGAAQVASHFALIGLIGAVVLTAFGTAWARVLWFPLLFLFFAVPFGEALVPRLMDWTAEVTIWALKLTGVPVYREGVHFVIPTGQWSVIEACSGIKFLIASIMAGSLYAWLMYRSPGRRIAFVAASIVVPLLANWLRAYSIVMIGHLSNNRLMTNEDHIVFGWVLFGAIMLLTYWLGTRWREDTDEVLPSAPAPRPSWSRLAVAFAAVGAAIVVWPAMAHVLMQPVGPAGPIDIVAPEPAGGWVKEAGNFSSWTPDLEGYSSKQTFVYRKGTQRVALLVASYRHQTQSAQVGSTANQLAKTTNEQWKQTARGRAKPLVRGESGVASTVRLGELRGPRSSDRLLVWHWYWVGIAPTASEAQTKLELARARLLRRPDTALWIAAYAPAEDARDAAERSLGEFARDMGPSLQHAFSETVAR